MIEVLPLNEETVESSFTPEDLLNDHQPSERKIIGNNEEKGVKKALESEAHEGETNFDVDDDIRLAQEVAKGSNDDIFGNYKAEMKNINSNDEMSLSLKIELMHGLKYASKKW